MGDKLRDFFVDPNREDKDLNDTESFGEKTEEFAHDIGRNAEELKDKAQTKFTQMRNDAEDAVD